MAKRVGKKAIQSILTTVAVDPREHHVLKHLPLENTHYLRTRAIEAIRCGEDRFAILLLATASASEQQQQAKNVEPVPEPAPLPEGPVAKALAPLAAQLRNKIEESDGSPYGSPSPDTNTR